MLLAVTAVLLDLLTPTLVLLAAAALTPLVRRPHWSSLSLTRPTGGLRPVGMMLVVAVLWTVTHLVLIMPVVERPTGQQQDTGGVGLVLLAPSVTTVHVELYAEPDVPSTHPATTASFWVARHLRRSTSVVPGAGVVAVVMTLSVLRDPAVRTSCPGSAGPPRYRGHLSVRLTDQPRPGPASSWLEIGDLRPSRRSP